MLYTVLCYNKEDVVWSWTKEEDDAVMAKLSVVASVSVVVVQPIPGWYSPARTVVPPPASITTTPYAWGNWGTSYVSNQ